MNAQSVHEANMKKRQRIAKDNYEGDSAEMTNFINDLDHKMQLDGISDQRVLEI